MIATCISCNQSPDINRGLVAYYPFSGNILDMCNVNQISKIGGAVLSTDRFGNENSACSFNGIDADILMDISHIPAIESKKAISWWYLSEEKPPYTEENSAENMIALVDTISAIGIQFGFRSAWYKTKGFDLWEWGGGTSLEMAFPEFGVWHHCVYTYNGERHLFYIDGKFVTSSNIKPKKGVPNQLMLGNYPGGPQYFKGKIDEIRFYNRVLNDSEIELLFNYP